MILKIKIIACCLINLVMTMYSEDILKPFLNKERDRNIIFLTVQNLTSSNQAITLLDGEASALGSSSVAANTVIATIPVGNQPFGVAYSTTSNRIYVVNNLDDNVSIINPDTNIVTGTINVGTSPRAIAYDSLDNRMYVGNRTAGTVSVINCATNLVIATLTVGTSPEAIAYDSAHNRMYVCNAGDNNVSVIDCTTNIVSGTTISVGTAPAGIAYNSLNVTMYVANTGSNNVSVINCTSNAVTATIGVTDPDGLAYNSINNTIYVSNFSPNTVTRINGATNTVVGAPIPVGTSPREMTFNSTNNMIYVSNSGTNTISVIDGTSNTVTYTVTVGLSPRGVAFNSNNNTMYNANASTDNVSVINAVITAVSITTNTNYAQLCNDILGNPIWIGGIDIYSYSQNYNQVTQPIAFNYSNPWGATKTYPVFPKVNEDQWQSTKQNIDIPKDFIADGSNTLGYTLLANQSVTFFFYGRQITNEERMNIAQGLPPMPATDFENNDIGIPYKYVGCKSGTAWELVKQIFRI